MKTEYLILWIDDKPESINVDKEDISDYLLGFGIKANYVEANGSHADIHTEIQETLNNEELDILVIDFQMAGQDGEGLDGDKLINQIRNTSHVWLPVIFYSQKGVPALQKVAAKMGLEGVFFAHRDKVTDKFKEVAKSLLKKEQSVKRTRGLLMEGVSEIDSTLLNIAEGAWQKLDATQKEAVIISLKTRLTDRVRDSQKSLKDAPTDDISFQSLFKTRSFMDSYDTYTRWKIVKKMLQLLEVDNVQQTTFIELFDGGTEEAPALIPLRNRYAHRTRHDLDKQDHSDDKCVHIRKELRRQLDNTQTLKNFLNETIDD